MNLWLKPWEARSNKSCVPVANQAASGFLALVPKKMLSFWPYNKLILYWPGLFDQDGCIFLPSRSIKTEKGTWPISIHQFQFLAHLSFCFGNTTNAPRWGPAILLKTPRWGIKKKSGQMPHPGATLTLHFPVNKLQMPYLVYREICNNLIKTREAPYANRSWPPVIIIEQNIYRIWLISMTEL